MTQQGSRLGTTGCGDGPVSALASSLSAMERGGSPESHGDQVRATSHPIPIDHRLPNFGRRPELGPENGAVSSLDPSIAAHYEQGSQAQRLAGGFPSGPLELARTQELIARHFPAAPTDLLDVGGGPGVYARWLAGLGYRVHVVEPSPCMSSRPEPRIRK